ncbi:YqzL-like protein, partial [Dysosmobacter welbionis]
SSVTPSPRPSPGPRATASQPAARSRISSFALGESLPC